MSRTTLGDALADGVVVLDGGLATELERRGNDLSSALWSARLVADNPAEVIAAHHAFVAAGAQVTTSASYQAPPDEPELLRRSVELARAAAGQTGWVAASVGPYGAVLADGSEYRGDYGLSVNELRRFHRPRLRTLVDTQPDVLAVETVPCLTEVEALLRELDGLGVAAWLSLTCDGERTRAGEPAADAFAMAGDCASVIAVGVNCTTPADVDRLVPIAAESSGKAVVAYPNSGETWDAARRRWTGRSRLDPTAVRAWVAAGARLVGGCCRVAPADIAVIAASTRGALVRAD